MNNFLIQSNFEAKKIASIDKNKEKIILAFQEVSFISSWNVMDKFSNQKLGCYQEI